MKKLIVLAALLFAHAPCFSARAPEQNAPPANGLWYVNAVFVDPKTEKLLQSRALTLYTRDNVVEGGTLCVTSVPRNDIFPTLINREIAQCVGPLYSLYYQKVISTAEFWKQAERVGAVDQATIKEAADWKDEAIS